MNYEVQIGSNYNMSTQREEPAKRIEITAEEAEILKAFADIRRDDELNTIYVINNCSFKICPLL